MQTAYAGIPSGRPVHGTQHVDTFKGALQHKGIIVKISAFSAFGLHLIACQ
jgi:hypothetical protein